MAITDLTNTNWTLNDTIGLLSTNVSVDFTVHYLMYNGAEYSYAFTQMLAGRVDVAMYFDFVGGEFYLETNRDLVLYDSTQGKAYAITFTGGTDVTNTNLISWLEANGTCTSGGKPDPTVTYDLTTLDLPEGTHNISVRAKAEGYKNSAVSNSVEYVVEPQGVTLAAGTYVANNNFNSLADAVRYEGQPLNFSSNGVNYSSIGGRGNADFWYDNTMVYYQTSDDGDTFYWKWTNTAYKTITLETDQTVSAEFGEWFNSNFTVAPPSARIDVTSGSKSLGYVDMTKYVGYWWGDLCDGTVPPPTTTSTGVEIVFSETNQYTYLNANNMRGNISLSGSNVKNNNSIQNTVYTCNVYTAGSND